MEELFFIEEKELERHNITTLFFLFALAPFATATACLLYWQDFSHVSMFIKALFWLSYSVYIVVFAICTLDSPGDSAEIKQLTLKRFFALTLHYLLPGRKDRDREVEAFVWAQCERRRDQHLNQLVRQDRIAKLADFSMDDKFKELSKENLEAWVKQYVGKEKSLITFFNERVLGTKHLRPGLLYWSQIIPRKNNFDDFKFLLKLNPIVSADQVKSLKIITSEEVNFAFSGYTSEETKRLFSSSFILSDYLEVLNLSRENKLALKVSVDMKELLAWAQEMNAGIKGLKFYFPQDKKWIKALTETECRLGKIEFINNLSDLSYWAGAMSNCIKSYEDKIFAKQSYFFGVSVEGSPKLVFELNSKGNLIQAKRKANVHLSQEEDRYLRQFLTEHT